MKEVSTLSIKETKQYYDSLTAEDLCNCAYCRNYIREIRNAYLKVAEYLLALGVDIEKPFETIPLEPDETGGIEYLSSQYIVIGNTDGFIKTVIDTVTVDITDSHPLTNIDKPHFVIEIYPVRLKRTVQKD
jgi:hypothetical protein